MNDKHDGLNMRTDDVKIRFENVSFKYSGDEKYSLKGIDMCVKKGEFVAVLGHNGSGKSTLAKHINGLLLPTEGKVYVDGYDTTSDEDVLQIRRNTGMVFQNPDNQMVATTVEEEVAFGPENIGMEPALMRKRVDEAIDKVGMRDFIGREPHNLSGGQKQRVAIAGILAMAPDCIIFDEPTSMLDPVGRREVISTITKLHEEGITIILITHFMEEALLADRVIVMNDGDIVANGEPSKIFTDENLLRENSLEMPVSVYIANKLKNAGFDINVEVFEAQELVEEICRLR